jgi:hypothetical protein
LSLPAAVAAAACRCSWPVQGGWFEGEREVGGAGAGGGCKLVRLPLAGSSNKKEAKGERAAAI